jgi:predicted O-methyltransferase YrrM
MANRELPTWYPKGVNHVIDLENDPSPYGEPAPGILAVVKRRLQVAGAKIVDIAGGYGRYAMPLAMEGHDVTIVDIDPPHLKAAERNAASLPEGVGTIKTIDADITQDEDLHKIGSDYDASLNLAFLYLAPPETAKCIFRRYATLHKPGGLAVVQFSTAIERRDEHGNALVGEDEYSYNEPEGRRVLVEMYHQAGFENLEINPYTIHREKPYFVHAEVLVASGIRTK